ncbi:MAG TPA: ankyrin repeat domain-containing protein [Longimicrobiales bacterium]
MRASQTSTSDTMAMHDAFVRGELDGLRRALGEPSDFPNTRLPLALGDDCLGYAIAHSPLVFIRSLIDAGADVNRPDDGGFPSLLAALSTGRADRHEILRLLLERGADVAQRGVNDYTPLHYAAALDDVAAIELLLAAGADAAARTRIDDRTTPLEEAELLGNDVAARALREREL